jgi:hypothetical protein
MAGAVMLWRMRDKQKRDRKSALESGDRGASKRVKCDSPTAATSHDCLAEFRLAMLTPRAPRRYKLDAEFFARSVLRRFFVAA